MQLNPSEISDLIKKRIENFDVNVEAHTEGTVVSVTDGIIRVHGLSEVMQGEMLEFPGDSYGMALNLERDSVGVVMLGAYQHITEGDIVKCTGRILEVPVGEALLGRVVDALGNPIDGKGEIDTDLTSPVEKIAPGVIARQSVDQPVQLGLKSIDSMIPVGRGQRELIIGDRQTGKTAVALDTIINQKGKDLVCIYVAIGQKKAAVARTVAMLEEQGAMDHTIVVLASADESAALQYIAPYAGCAMGEEFMETGRDALVVYDDLSKHAWAYRQVSLLLRRPPGREAYPGDLFYIHSRLLERAAQVDVKYVIVKNDFEGEEATAEDAVNGKVYAGPLADTESEEAVADMSDVKIVRVEGTGGSLTALPIIETLLGDVSAYVPTNVISITDGQILLKPELFYAGQRPAMDVGASVSRVGSSAQTKAMKAVSKTIKGDISRYNEVKAFAQFGTEGLDASTRNLLNQGEKLMEMLKQGQYTPMTLEEQVVSLVASTLIEDLPTDDTRRFEQELLAHMRDSQGELMAEIRESQDLSDDNAEKLKGAIETFKSGFRASA